MPRFFHALLSHRVFAPLLLGFAVVIAYSNGLGGPFIFDDVDAIVNNPTIRQLDAGTWTPPDGLTVSGRPVLNVTLALNYAWGGETVRSYHVVNIGIHALNAACLFALLRRVFQSRRLARHFSQGADTLAFAIALLWALHPLQTQSVTYVIQRAESLVGLFYLATLYGFARATGASEGAANALMRQRGWLLISVLACALGMASKEVMVSAPLAVILYDRVFLSASFREIWRARWRYYLALASTWLLLATLVWRTGDRGNTAGFSVGVSPLDYALTQGRAIAHYLKLSFWPHPLVFDYGEYEPANPAALLPFCAIIVALLGGTAWLWRRHQAAAFAGTMFFFLLAPTSSILPIFTEPMAEHRMYLPLAALIALLAGILHACVRLGGWTAVVLVMLAAIAGIATFQRNRDYRSARVLWETTVDEVPNNARAQISYATALAEEGAWTEAERHFKIAIELRPDSIGARSGLAALLVDQRRLDEAANESIEVVRLEPTNALAHNALGTIRYEQGRLENAARDFLRAVELRPDFAEAHNNLGGVLTQLGNFPAAKIHLETALRVRPDYAEAHYNLGNVLFNEARLSDALRSYEAALRLKPDYAAAHAHKGVVLQNLGQREEAIRAYREALRLQPAYDFVRENLKALGAER